METDPAQEIPSVGNRSTAGGEVSEILLHAERLGITTSRVATERVRFTKRIVTTTRTIEVPVRVEQLVVTHEALPADFATPEVGGFPELVIVLHEEVPEVTLRVVPVERITVDVVTAVRDEVVTAELAAEVLDVSRS